ncbi:MAG: glycoside hydrolase family 97 N-terminal domain-containing protein, partial [Salinivirgaceae bacterium]|nr:glycoside hydrolase family 97 N-terminal domain-containing protein [Salinivirgaceae bacterium]
MRILSIAAAAAIILTGCNKANTDVTSPDGRIKVSFSLTANGEPRYSAQLNGQTVIGESQLGLDVEGCNLKDGFRLISTAETVVDEQYSLKTGKQTDYHYRANEKIFNLLAKSGDTLGIAFRLSDDGFAFRYQLNSLKGGQNIV